MSSTFLDVGLLLGNLECIVDLNAEVLHRALEFGVPQEQLNRPQILRAPVYQSRLRAPERMRAIGCRIKPDVCEP